ncbi:MAG: class I SAM-dependent methyltransferase [Nitrososphaerales archaeon]|nr:class I SAM-dependent methyltransferase [Nitrososphaerales archaeon]
MSHVGKVLGWDCLGTDVKLSFVERLRTAREDPYALLGRIGIAKGMRVADLGAGKGLYTLVAAELVGGVGWVYAVEPDTARSALIGRRAAGGGFANITVLKTRAEDMSGIPDSGVDFAFSLNALHHFEDRDAALSEAKRILKKDGRLYVRDMVWNMWFRHGTRKEDVGSIAAGVFTNVKVNLTARKVEITFTK